MILSKTTIKDSALLNYFKREFKTQHELILKIIEWNKNSLYEKIKKNNIVTQEKSQILLYFIKNKQYSKMIAATILNQELSMCLQNITSKNA